MTSALRHTPSQAKRETRRFNTLVAQRRRLLAALTSALTESNMGLTLATQEKMRAAIAEVRGCQVVPFEDAK